MIDTLQNLTELQALPEKCRLEMRNEMPRNAGECKIYTMLVIPTLLKEMCNGEMDMMLVCSNFREWFEARRFDKMHMFLVMCFCVYNFDPPPYLYEFGLFDDLLEMLMQEVITHFDALFNNLSRVIEEAYAAE